MAAQDYYNSFAPGPSGLRATQQRPPQPPQAQQLFPPTAYPAQTPPQQGLTGPPSELPSHPPPPYSPYQQQQQQQQQYQPAQQSHSPFYPSPSKQQNAYQPPQQQQTGYLAPPGHDPNGAPLKPARSYSTPPDKRQHHHQHHHHRRRHHSRDSSRSRSRSRSRSGSSSREPRESYNREGYDRAAHQRRGKTHHKDMDTFLGAGGGAIIGDAIFPGLGTIGGLLLGGYGGREYAKKHDAKSRRDKELRHAHRDDRRSRSSAPDYRYERRDSGKY